ncbi:hypothetical protein FB45DRAFT_899736 [Roridomyces roridus]|uniref:F-box domain-containing protein n=1 Tax=Roridomyces roridus TaxID=1738132 RepID=A0AAD7C7T0_9AGAR|nr:hypothetical protein FB45DRAFT_899736 [Roridomyces roridus]
MNLVPPEILSEILSLLDPKTLLGCSTVCRTWHESIRDTPNLQYIIELWRDGLEPGYDGHLPVKECLNTLHQRRQAWRNISWKCQKVIDIPGIQVCKAYELVGGVLAVQERGAPNFCTLPLAELAVDSDTSVSTQVLPMEIDLENYLDFNMDPTQDLLVILCQQEAGLRHIFFRTVSGLQPHPRALEPSIIFTVNDEDLPGSLSIHIAEDLVAVSVLYPAQVYIFKWQCATLLANIRPPGRGTCFQFLSSRALLLVSPEDEGRMEIHTISDDERGSVTHVATLRLPTVASGWLISLIWLHSGPICGRAMHRRLFSSADTCHIYSFHVQYTKAHVAFWARLFVHHRTLRRYISEYFRQECTPPTPIDVPWEEWGPDETRMLQGDHRRWHRHVHGERVILPSNRASSLHVLDFSLSAAGAPVISSDWPVDEMILGPTTIEPHSESPFESPVTTTLPFRSTLRDIPTRESFDQFLLEQDCVLGADSQDPNKITVFVF